MQLAYASVVHANGFNIRLSYLKRFKKLNSLSSSEGNFKVQGVDFIIQEVNQFIRYFLPARIPTHIMLQRVEQLHTWRENPYDKLNKNVEIKFSAHDVLLKRP